MMKWKKRYKTTLFIVRLVAHIIIAYIIYNVIMSGKIMVIFCVLWPMLSLNLQYTKTVYLQTLKTYVIIIHVCVSLD